MTPDEFIQNLPNMNAPEKMTEMVRVLTGPQGCPWDQKQTARTIINFVIDEAHELKEALETEQDSEIASEFGDLLFAMEFLTQAIALHTTPKASTDLLVEKMVRRHPHVFSDLRFASEAELKKNWEKEKRLENATRERYDQDIPASLPPLQRAVKVLSRASNAGFRYLATEDAWDKVCEEFSELEQAILSGDSEATEAELGDLLLALLTVSKMAEISPPQALNRAVSKLCDRLQKLEQMAGKPIQDLEHRDLAGWYRKAREESQKTGAYFNYCGVSPWPREVRNAVRRAARDVSSEGLPAALKWRESREELRAEIRSFTQAPESASVVFVPNVSSAALGVAFSQNWPEGSKIVLGRGEFPANTVPWRQAAKNFGWEVRWFQEDLLRTDPDKGWAELEVLLREEKPRLMAVSAVSFWSGFRMPLKRLASLCQAFDTQLFVDGIQAFGTLQLNMLDGVDYLAGGSHKAMTSPEGAGFLLVSERARSGWNPRLSSWLSLPEPVDFLLNGVDYLAGGSHKAMTSPEGAGFLLVSERARSGWNPRLSSWLSLPEPVDFLLNGEFQSLPNDKTPREGDPTTLEGGSINALGYAGLAAAVELYQRIGGENILHHILELQGPVVEALEGYGWTALRSAKVEERSAILSFRPPQGVNLPLLQQEFSERNVSVGIPNGCLRFGFHHFSTRSDVDYALKVLSALSPLLSR